MSATVTITNIKNPSLSFGGKFATLEGAQIWLNEQKTFNFRRPEREIQDGTESYDPQDVISERVANIDGINVRYVTLCAEATYVIEDTTETDTLGAQKETRQKIGRSVDHIGNEIIYAIIGFNKERGLTDEQIDQMETLFAPILSALQNYRLVKPKALIQAIDPTTTGGLVTQEMKDEILAIFAKYGV